MRTKEVAPRATPFSRAMLFQLALRGLVPALALCVALGNANAQSTPDFYKGRTVELDIQTSVGGGYDSYARLLARFMPKYIPGNPTILPKNMPGAGGLLAANYLYNVAPHDGSVIGIISRGTAFDPLLGNTAAHLDGTKFNWIGSANNEVSVCVTWNTSGIRTFDDARKKETVVGATGPTADTYQFPKIVNAVLGSKFKIVTGYKGGNEVDLAMERGEVQGRCGWSWTSVKGIHQDWLSQKKLNILFQVGLSKHRDLPDVPLIIDRATNDADRALLKLVFSRQVMAWPFLTPPGVPADRVALLRRAFLDTMKDKDFLAGADKAGLEITPVSGTDIQKLVSEVYATPPAITKRAADLLTLQSGPR
ncbi:MAG TPA: hypothetical protein VL402_01545 [Xanthobacteraceae bacterium]|jgi:tripartite-type tricarboxylate transporter receptor subunit TctC|nr:hypothetical protein [Xanthobacteraceae bacterium]